MMRRSNAILLLSTRPRFFQRMLPVGKAAPVVSVVAMGIRLPLRLMAFASVHSMATAGLVTDEKSMLTLLGGVHKGSGSCTDGAPGGGVAGHGGGETGSGGGGGGGDSGGVVRGGTGGTEGGAMGSGGGTGSSHGDPKSGGTIAKQYPRSD